MADEKKPFHLWLVDQLNLRLPCGSKGNLDDVLHHFADIRKMIVEIIIPSEFASQISESLDQYFLYHLKLGAIHGEDLFQEEMANEYCAIHCTMLGIPEGQAGQ